MPPNLEKRTGWKLAVFHTLSCTLPKFSEAYQPLEFTGCSTFGASFLQNRCHLGTLWGAEWWLLELWQNIFSASGNFGNHWSPKGENNTNLSSALGAIWG